MSFDTEARRLTEEASHLIEAHGQVRYVHSGYAVISVGLVVALGRGASTSPSARSAPTRRTPGKKNLQAVAHLGAVPFVPFKATRNAGPVPAIHADVTLPDVASAWLKMYAYFVYQRDTFLSHCHKRSSVETTFSMIMRKFGDSLRSKSDTGQMNEVLCKVIAYNLCCLIAAIHELGLEQPAFVGNH